MQTEKMQNFFLFSVPTISIEFWIQIRSEKWKEKKFNNKCEKMESKEQK